MKRFQQRSVQSSATTGRSLRMEQLESRYLLTAFDVLVFSKTAGFRHGSIAAGISAIQSLGAANDFSVTTTENANQFTAANLANYEAVVFLNTTGDILNNTQQAAFEQYIQSGGGWVGIHAAADAEYNWAWYGELLGAYFQNHPATQQATIVVADQVHPSTEHLPERWVRTDEWYNFRTNPRGDVHVLATLDESTYNGGQDGFDHPIAWYHDFDGGRSWYTGFGHTSSTFSEPLIRDHLLGGILYAAGQVATDGGATVEDNFEKVELYDDSTKPMSLEVADDGRVFFVEKAGAVKVYDPSTNNTTTAAQLSVYTGQEDGLLGIALDPDFSTNNWVYLFYSPSGSTPKQHLSRFTLSGNQLLLGSEEVLLEVPTQRSQCCHSGGSLAFDTEGNLYVSTGDNTNPFQANGFAPIDERPGRSAWDAQKSSSNTHDLRGKILRIHPEPDGTYTIPNGNLFPTDGSGGRPEVYVMGNRNPFRISIDAETGTLYWGDVGPDALNDNSARGPRGYDEINRATSAGNYGWPYFIADNQPYRDYNFANGQSGAFFDPAAPVNNSPNNTGATNLPPAQEALIWYPYGPNTDFPELGTTFNRTAMAGPVYHHDPGLASNIKLPEYFDDTLFIYDWSRQNFSEVKFDTNGEILKINPFLPETLNNVRAIDMELGPDGALYILQWNGGVSSSATGSKLLRVEFTGNPLFAPADFNRDGFVDSQDLSQWQGDYGLNGDSDADSDGDTDGADFLAWQRGYAPGPPFLLPPQLGNTVVDAGSSDSWNSNLVVNETDTYTNTQGEAQSILLETFNFHADSTTSPVTPFVVRVNADNDFTVLAVGTTRTSYSLGNNSVAFSAGGPTAVTLEAGQTLAIGFLDANANGSNSVDAAIPFINGGDQIWYTGSPGTGSGSVAVGAAPTPGPEVRDTFNRDYLFNIGISLGSTLQAVGGELSTPNLNASGAANDSALNELFSLGARLRLSEEEDPSPSLPSDDANRQELILEDASLLSVAHVEHLIEPPSDSLQGVETLHEEALEAFLEDSLVDTGLRAG